MAKRVIIGVTGALATGKTTITGMFAGKGAVKIDADKITHQLLEENEQIIRKVISLFSERILTEQRIDRRKLAKEVFPDKKKLNMLCELLHPAIILRIKEQAKKFQGQTIVIDAPLLIEAGLHDYVDVVVVAISRHETQIERAQNRGISGEEAKGIIANQMPLSEKTKFADFIIDTDKNLDTTKKGVDKIWEKIQELKKN